MAFLVALLTLALVALVVLVVGAPLRRGRRAGQSGHGPNLTSASADAPTSMTAASHVEDLEAAREAKYREIRDAELDFRTGKLSRKDYEAIDADLRAEALDILNRLEPSNSPAVVAGGDAAHGDPSNGDTAEPDPPSAGFEAGN